MGKKILLVDDEPDFVHLVQSRLLQQGYEVLTAQDGGEAVRVAVKERPDLIIMDIVMPGMDGVQASRILKEDPRTENTPVLFLTALKTKEEEKMCEDAGPHVIMAKPFDPVRFLAKVAMMLAPGS